MKKALYKLIIYDYDYDYDYDYYCYYYYYLEEMRIKNKNVCSYTEKIGKSEYFEF